MQIKVTKIIGNLSWKLTKKDSLSTIFELRLLADVFNKFWKKTITV